MALPSRQPEPGARPASCASLSGLTRLSLRHVDRPHAFPEGHWVICRAK